MVKIKLYKGMNDCVNFMYSNSIAKLVDGNRVMIINSHDEIHMLTDLNNVALIEFKDERINL